MVHYRHVIIPIAIRAFELNGYQHRLIFPASILNVHFLTHNGIISLAVSHIFPLTKIEWSTPIAYITSFHNVTPNEILGASVQLA